MVGASNNLTVIGHRGASGYELENTVESFEKAIKLGVDMIELDIQRCLSGEVVVYHDENISRLFKRNEDINFMPWTELRKLRINGKNVILSLTEALDSINRRVPVNIEIKSGGMARIVVDIIQYYVKRRDWDYKDFLVSSYNYRQLKTLRKYAPKIRLGAIIEDKIPSFFWTHAKELNLFSLHTTKNLVYRDIVKKAHDRRIKVFVFTINSREELLEILPYGIDGVFSDFPDLVR